jgi:hypothetical protein
LRPVLPRPWYKLALVIDVSVLQLLLLAMTGWLDRREREALAYLIEENRVLRRQIGGRRLQLTDDDRRRLAVRAYRRGREVVREVATLVTPDTLLRWAPATGGTQVDVYEAASESVRCPCRDPAPHRPNGRGQSDVGLHANSRCP